MIIIPVTAAEVPGALEQIAAANVAGDAIELRLDFFPTLSEKDLKRMVRACKKPCICTCRSRREGGKFSGTGGEMAEALRSAIRNGADFVDVEFGANVGHRKKVFDYAKKHGAKVILSKHYTTHTPQLSELSDLLERMRKENAHVVKIVTRARSGKDNKTILSLFKDANRKRVKLIAFCMGSLGTDSRILSRFVGAFATFASLARGKESAEGQIPAAEMRKRHSELAGEMS